MTVSSFKTKDIFGEEGVNDNFKWQSRQTTPEFPGTFLFEYPYAL